MQRCELCNHVLVDNLFVYVPEQQLEDTVADYNTNVKLAELSSVRPDRLEKIANTALTTCANCYQKLKDRLESNIIREAKLEKELQALLAGAKLRSAIEEISILSANIDEKTANALDAKESELTQTLEIAASEWEHATSESEQATISEGNLVGEEERHWKEVDLFLEQVQNTQEQLELLQHTNASYQAELQGLNSVSVYQDLFQISAVQGIATINGMRLGRLPSISVEWDELNHAWGETTLSVYLMAHKLQYKFTRFQLVPLGNRSTIRLLEQPNQPIVVGTNITAYPLYGSEDSRFARGTFAIWPWTGSGGAGSLFDEGMECFLSCVKELWQYCSSLDSAVAYPLRIEKDKIQLKEEQPISIRIQSNTEEKWTQALRYMLTLIKRLLGHTSQLCSIIAAREKAEYSMPRAIPGASWQIPLHSSFTPPSNSYITQFATTQPGISGTIPSAQASMQTHPPQ